jgi:hypothetical protein
MYMEMCSWGDVEMGRYVVVEMWRCGDGEM